MHSITKIFLSSIFFGLVSCQHNPTHNVMVDVAAMPPEPEWVEFTRKPIIGKQDNNFLVSDEFVEKALQQKTHLDRVSKWKTENQVP